MISSFSVLYIYIYECFCKLIINQISNLTLIIGKNLNPISTLDQLEFSTLKEPVWDGSGGFGPDSHT